MWNACFSGGAKKSLARMAWGRLERWDRNLAKMPITDANRMQKVTHSTRRLCAARIFSFFPSPPGINMGGIGNEIKWGFEANGAREFGVLIECGGWGRRWR